MNYSCKNEIVDKIIQFFNALIEILYDCMYGHNRHEAVFFSCKYKNVNFFP